MKVIPGFLLLTGYFELKIKFFSPLTWRYKYDTHISCVIIPYFSKEIFLKCVIFLLLLNVLNGQNKQTNKTTMIWKDNQWQYQVRKVTCQGHILLLHVPISGVPFEWSSVPIKSNLALSGYNVYSSLCLHSSPFRIMSLAFACWKEPMP